MSDHDVPDAIEPEFPNEQRWGLYAPDPSTTYSWYIIEAELENGSTVDAFDGGEVVTERPADASQQFDTFRDRKFMETVRDSGRDDTNNVTAERYAEWGCEQANATHDDAVEHLEVYRYVQDSPVDGEFEDPRGPFTVIEREC